MRATEPARTRRRCPVAALIVLSALGPGALSAADPGTGAANRPAPGPEASIPFLTDQGPEASQRVTPWLDEVRAQREAWEARRKAAHEAFEARRRAVDPWGAAQDEAWDDAFDRRFEARRQQIEQDREHFRAMGPAAPPLPPPWPEPLRPGLGTAQDPGAQLGPLPGGAVIYPPGAPPRAPYSPQDWDNLWYYRGY